jgi:PadR family transcriptional regulator, regulatory protein PadR
LDLLILKTIAREPLHGWGIAKRIQLLSRDVLSVGQGSLYPALHRLEQQGWISAEWKDSDLGRPAKIYSLTREGRKQLERELKSWDRLSSAVQLLIESAEGSTHATRASSQATFRFAFSPAACRFRSDNRDRAAH